MKQPLTVTRILILAVLLILIVGMPRAVSAAQRLYYTGTIGKSAVQMDLTFTGTTISGTYWYESTKALYDEMGVFRNTLTLKGTLNAKGQVSLAETDFDDKKTGAISGAFSNNSMQFTGTWTKPNSTTTLPVSLSAVAQYNTISLNDTKRRLQTKATYPELLATVGSAGDIGAYLRAWCNINLNGFFTSCLTDGIYREADPGCTQDLMVTLACYSPTFVSLLVEDSQYTGGAHPDSYFKTFNIALEKDRFTYLTFETIFKEESIDALRGLISGKLQQVKKARGTAGEIADKLDANVITTVLLLPAGAVFVFPRYLVGSYAEGEYFVTVPYIEMAEMINFKNEQLPPFVLRYKPKTN